MTLTQMMYFREICDRHGVTAAANALHVSQPTLSNAIRELEREFQVMLFTRYNKQLILTREGTYFYQRVCAILSAAEELDAAMRDFGNLDQRLRIGVPPMIGTFLFPDMLARFRALWPEVQIETVEHGSLRTMELLEEGTLDLAIVAADDAGSDPFYTLPVLDSQMMFCVTPEHPLAERAAVGAAALAEYPLVLMKDDTYHVRLLLRSFQSAGVQPAILLRTEQLYTIQQYILRGEAGGFLLREVVELNPGMRGIPLDPPVQLQIRILWPRGRRLPSSADRFLQFARDYRPKFHLSP